MRQLWAFCSVLVACVAAILDSAVLTSWTVRSLSGIVPMTTSSGRSASSVYINCLGRAARQALVEPVGYCLLNGVAVSGPDARIKLGVHFLELVPDLGPGLAAELLANPLAVRVEAERDHAAPAPVTGPVMGATRQSAR